jgi:uncharacterized protein involved in copper resistance
MHTLFRLISRYLLLVMLATVISPSFGWETAQGMTEHEHAAMAGMSDQHAGHEMPADENEAACCPDLQHHCCLGHQLGHPQGNTISQLLPATPAAIATVLSERFLTRVPEGLERPPRSVSV